MIRNRGVPADRAALERTLLHELSRVPPSHLNTYVVTANSVCLDLNILEDELVALLGTKPVTLENGFQVTLDADKVKFKR